MAKSKKLRKLLSNVWALVIKFFSNGWVLGIGTTVIGGLVFNLITGYRFDWLFDLFGWFAGIPPLILDFFTAKYELPLYGLIFIFLSAPLLVVLFFAISAVWMRREARKTRESEIATSLEWMDYKRDRFNGMPYRWDYETRQNQIYIEKIRCHCPVCDCVLIEFRCPNCNNSYYNEVKTENEIKALILLRLEKDFGQNT